MGSGFLQSGTHPLVPCASEAGGSHGSIARACTQHVLHGLPKGAGKPHGPGAGRCHPAGRRHDGARRARGFRVRRNGQPAISPANPQSRLAGLRPQRVPVTRSGACQDQPGGSPPTRRTSGPRPDQSAAAGIVPIRGTTVCSTRGNPSAPTTSRAGATKPTDRGPAGRQGRAGAHRLA